MVILAAFCLVRAQGWRVPLGVHGVLAGFITLVRVLRLGDGVQDRYFAQRFSLYDFAMLPEGVRFAHSVLPWWKFFAALLAVVAVLVLLPFATYRALRAAEAYFDDVRRVPFVGLLTFVAFGIGLVQPRKVHHQQLFMRGALGGFGTSVGPRLRREASYLMSVYADREKWEHAVARAGELLARTPSNLAKLERKNVHLILVESYGVIAVERPDFVKTITPTFDAIESELGALGYSNCFRAARFDDVRRSLLARAIDARDGDPRYRPAGLRYGRAGEAAGSVRLFRAAGYRTVLAAPAVTRKELRGDLYRFDKNYYYADFDYAGPAFGWATMPDQFVFDLIRRRELTPTAGPLFVQYILVSSHAPWSETPTIVEDWERLQNGALFDTQPVLRFPIVWPNFEHAHEAYIRSLVYDFEIIKRYIARFLNDDSLVIVLGDHQPVVEISGDEHLRTVPVHVFSKNEAFVQAFTRRGYVPGMWPRGNAKARGMETFLPDLLRDFSTAPAQPSR